MPDVVVNLVWGGGLRYGAGIGVISPDGPLFAHEFHGTLSGIHLSSRPIDLMVAPLGIALAIPGGYFPVAASGFGGELSVQPHLVRNGGPVTLRSSFAALSPDTGDHSVKPSAVPALSSEVDVSLIPNSNTSTDFALSVAYTHLWMSSATGSGLDLITAGVRLNLDFWRP